LVDIWEDFLMSEMERTKEMPFPQPETPKKMK